MILKLQFSRKIKIKMEWIIENRTWFLSGLGVVVLGWIGNLILEQFKKTDSTSQISNSIVVNNTMPTIQADNIRSEQPESRMSLPDRKAKTKILFIDDDTKFKVVKILANSGWLNTSIIKDAKTLDEPAIINAHILFVDVQGVGVSMGFDSEGLGLALALKEKYPSKKIVIYSAETKGDRFHDALRKADSFLPKNADPYEFQKVVEELSLELSGQI